MYERCPFCGSAVREVRSVAGHISQESESVAGNGVDLKYGLWWRCLGCGADYGRISWDVQQLIVGNIWAPSGRQTVYRPFDFLTLDTKPQRRLIGSFNYRREIVKITEGGVEKRP